VHVYVSPFKAVNRGSNHAHRHRLEILRRTVQELLIVEPWAIEVSRKLFLVKFGELPMILKPFSGILV
jgi:hypothetical protein